MVNESTLLPLRNKTFLNLQNPHDLIYLTGATEEKINGLISQIPYLYHQVDVEQKKKNNVVKWRHLDKPAYKLKSIQQQINKNLLAQVKFPNYIIGGIKDKAYENAAKIHIGKPEVVTMDIRDFYPSIDNQTIYNCLQLRFGFSPAVARIVTRLTTLDKRLPQGAPTSSYLASIATWQMHAEIYKYLQSHNITYAVVVDDLSFAGKNAHTHIDKVVKIVESHGLSIKMGKTKIMPSNHPQLVTNLLVNGKLSVTDGYMRKAISRIKAAEKDNLNDLASCKGIISFVKRADPKKAKILTLLATKKFGELLSKHIEVKKKKPSNEYPCLGGNKCRWHKQRDNIYKNN